MNKLENGNILLLSFGKVFYVRNILQLTQIEFAKLKTIQLPESNTATGSRTRCLVRLFSFPDEYREGYHFNVISLYEKERIAV